MRWVATEHLSMPALGLGTFRLEGPEARRMTRLALAEGYRHIDTAQMYANEAEVGAGIAEADTPRSEVFVTTKIWPDDFRRCRFDQAVEDSLRRLRTDYIDLLLLHWPSQEVALEETLGALARAVKRGQVRYAGVSNFTMALFDEAAGKCGVPLVVDQVEYHPYLDQRPLRRFLEQRGAVLTAYCPLAQGRVAGDPEIRRIAEAHAATPSQVVLAWLLAAENTAAIPKTASPERMAENLGALEVRLEPADIAAIDALAEPGGRMISPAGLAPDWD